MSSPGLGRTLKKDRHLARSIGEEVEIKLYKPLDGTKEYAGVLKSFDEGVVVITEGTMDRIFARNDIAVIRLALDF